MLLLKRLVASVLLIVAAVTASAQSEYQIQIGDRLAIEVLEDNSLNRTVEVLPDGRFSFPYAGSVTGAGRTVAQVQAAITSGIASNFAIMPTVFVSVQPGARAPLTTAAPRTMDIYFLGEVEGPGMKTVEPGTTFLQALSQSGGLTRFAATKRVQLRRTGPDGQPVVYTINYKALTKGANLTADMILQDGDVILVPERRLFE